MKRKIYILLVIMLSLYILPSININASGLSEVKSDVSIVEENVWIEIETSDELKAVASEMGMTVVSYEYHEGLNIQNINADGSVEQNVSNSTYFVPDDMIIPMASGTKYEEDPIVFYAAKAYSTITYNRYTDSQKIAYVKLTKVSGGVKNIDTGWRFVKQKAMYSCTGSWDGNPLGTQREERTTTSITFSYNCPSNWAGVNAQGGWRLVGLATDITLQHGNGAKYTV